MRRALLLAVLALLAIPGVAQAGYPGENGKIVFSAKLGGDPAYHLYTVNPDGTGQTQITFGAANDKGPQVSPDGQQVAFYSDRSEPSPGAYVVNADGTGLHRLSLPEPVGGSPSWSPDGTRVVYPRGLYAWTAALDGSDPQQVTFPSPECYEESVNPRWSPDGTYIAINIRSACPTENTILELFAPDGSAGPFINSYPGVWDWSPDAQKLIANESGDTFTYSRDGSYISYYAFFLGSFVVWSPNGSRLLMNDASFIYSMNFDESGRQDIAAVPSTQLGGFDWAPILKGYPRPKGAGTLHAPLVPAYQPCTSPNRVHSAPLSYNSCNPPTRTSPQLTIGTPDANGKGANSVASLRIGVIPGNPGTPADEAEANLITSITDVRNASDLSDYTGNLEIRVPLQITDKSNTPYPGGPGPGTVQSFTFTWNVPCTATADPNIGASCSLFTTADTLLPGSALEGRRAIWETDRIEVRDGSGQPFLRQGVFVP